MTQHFEIILKIQPINRMRKNRLKKRKENLGKKAGKMQKKKKLFS